VNIDDYRKILEEHRDELGSNYTRIVELVVSGKSYEEVGKIMSAPANKIAGIMSKLRKRYIKESARPTKNSKVRIITPEKAAVPTVKVEEKSFINVSVSKKCMYTLLITDDKEFIKSLIQESGSFCN
jgi:hypothetical protein